MDSPISLTYQNSRQKVFKSEGFAILRGGFVFVRGAWNYKINQNFTYL